MVQNLLKSLSSQNFSSLAFKPSAFKEPLLRLKILLLLLESVKHSLRALHYNRKLQTTLEKEENMGSGQSLPETTTPKPQLLNHSTTLQSDTYSVIFNVGAGAGIMMIILIIAMILARILFPKLFTGLCNKSGKTRDHMEQLYTRIKNRYRRVDQNQANNPAPPPPPFFPPVPIMHPMQPMMAPHPMMLPMHMPMPPMVQYQQPVNNQRQEQRFVELPPEQNQPANPPLPPRPLGNV